MSDKAKELLEDALIWFEATGNCFDLSDEIRAYLAEPEKKQEPLSSKEINESYAAMHTLPIKLRYMFRRGVRFAEKHHGIGGEE